MRKIKKYGNRKLYDTHTHDYITQKDIVTYIKTGIPFQIIHTKTKNDITAQVLLDIMYRHELDRARPALEVDELKSLIKTSDGSFTGVLRELEYVVNHLTNQGVYHV